jgi:Ppx/GppA phosphatase family
MIFMTTPLIYSIEQPTSISQLPITRAAFDLGSGVFKLAIAEVSEKDIQLKFSKVIKVGLGVDLAESLDNTLSEKVQTIAIKALKELIQEARNQGATQFAGIATAVFRKAVNGKEFLQKLQDNNQMPLCLISQEQEGILAFKTFLNAFLEIEENHCIALDIGSASFQLTAKNNTSYDVFNGPLGISGVLKIFSEEIRQIPYQKNTLFVPITLDEMILLVERVKSKIFSSSWIQAKLSNELTTVFYIDDWIGQLQLRIGQVNKISKNQLWKTLVKITHPSDSTPDREKQSYMIASVLLYSILSKLHINEVRIKLDNTGNAMGMMKEEYFWH